MSNWVVQASVTSNQISMHPDGQTYQVRWLTLEEAQSLVEQLQEAIGVLEAATVSPDGSP